MEKQLEHKIKQAFQKKDENSSFAKKDELWFSISNEIGSSKGVATFWKVAAVVLALITFGGAFATVSVLRNQKEKLTEIEGQGLKLQHLVDSLMNIEPETITEIQIVEKEKLVYKEILVPVNRGQTYELEKGELKNEVKQLNEELLKWKQNLQLVTDSLRIARAEIETGKHEKTVRTEENKHNFKLKTEKAKDQEQPNLIKQTPKLKLQLFKTQSGNMKFDTSYTH